MGFRVNAIKMLVKSKSAEISANLKNKQDESEMLLDAIKDHPTQLENMILYIINANKIKYIVIEDMERYLTPKEANKDDNQVLKIISQFKQLSDLISRSKIVKNKVIFIYGLNESCFNDSEKRSKFFDLILPIIPLSNYVSSGQALLDSELINELNNKQQLSSDVINRLSLFFTNQRQINAFTTQFYLYYRKKEHEHVDVNQLFAITALITLFPKFSHGMHEKNNDLDKLLDHEWTVDSSGVCKFANANIPFPNMVSDNKELSLFLKICTQQKYITKSYRFVMSLHNLADDKIFDTHDLEILWKFYADIDIKDELFNFPTAVLQWDRDDDFFSIKETIHSQLFDEAVKNDDNKHLRKFETCISSLAEKAKEETFIYLLDKCNDNSNKFLIDTYKNDCSFLNCIASVDKKRSYKIALELFRLNDNAFFTTNIKRISSFVQFISSSAFFRSLSDSLTKNDVERMIQLKFSINDISIFSNNKSIMDYFMESANFPFTFENILIAFPDFENKPLKVINNNPNFSSTLFKTDYIQILKKCSDNQDEESDVLTFVKENGIPIITAIVGAELFANKTFSITIPDYSESSIIGTNKLDVLLNHDLLDINIAYENFYNKNTPSFDAYVISKIDLICLKYNKPFNNSLSSHFLKVFDASFIDKIKDRLSFNEIVNDLASISAPVLSLIYPLVEDGVKKDVANHILKKDAKIFDSMISKEIFDSEDLKDIVLSQAAVSEIANNDLQKYFGLLLTENNYATFSLYLNSNPENKDFARFIFKEDGTLRKECFDLTLCLICSLSLENKGCIEKVVVEAPDEILRNNEWTNFIIKFVEKYGTKDQRDYYVIDSRVVLNKKVVERFVDLRRIILKRDARRSHSYVFKVIRNVLF